MRSTLWLGLLLGAGSMNLLAACGQVLGIEDAHEDPSLRGTNTSGGSTLVPDGSGGFAGTSGSGDTQGGSASQNPGGANGAGTSGAQAGAAGAAQDSELCLQYCSVAMANCDPQDPKKARLPQYADAEQCFAVCAALTPGSDGDRGVDTVQCRLRHAKMAAYELHECAAAGPHGGGECGKPCEVYCKQMMNICTATSTDLPAHYFKSNAECMDACSQVPNGPLYSATEANYTGNHLQCRMYHTVIAIMGAPEEHCEHAIGQSLCVEMTGAGGSGGGS